MPNCERLIPPDGAQHHDICLATYCCKRCGATTNDIAGGRRPPWCEPGVIGITWVRRAERMRDLIEGPMVELPLYRLTDLVPGRDGRFHEPPDEPGPSAA